MVTMSLLTLFYVWQHLAHIQLSQRTHLEALFFISSCFEILFSIGRHHWAVPVTLCKHMLRLLCVWLSHHTMLPQA